MSELLRRGRGAGRLSGSMVRGLVVAAALSGWVAAGALAQEGAPAQPEPAAQPTPHSEPVKPFPESPNTMQIKREAPPLKAEPNVIDLKYVQPGTKNTGTAKLTNVGAEAVKILRVTTSCHCTIPTDLSNVTLEPGESVDLDATLEAGKYMGAQQRQVRVFVDGYAVPLQLYVVAQVSHGVSANPVYIDAFQQKRGEVVLESVDGKTFKVECFDGRTPTAADFKDFDPEKDEPRSKYVYVYDLTNTPPDQLKPWFVVVTDHPTAPLIDLRVINPELIPKLTGQEPWRMGDDRVLLGTVKPGERKEFDVTLTRNAMYQDDSQPVVTSDDPNVTVELVSATKEGDSNMICKVAMTAKSSAEGCLIRPRVTFSWLEHSFPIDVFGRVEDASKGGLN